jgi:hypothetical protein
MLQGFGIVFVDLIGNKITPATGVNLPPFLKIRAGQTCRELLKKIFLDKVGAMGFRDQPALGGLLTMHRAKYFVTGHQCPTRLVFSLAPGFKRQVDEMIF